MKNDITIPLSEIEDVLEFIYQKSTEYLTSIDTIRDISIYSGLSRMYLFQIYYEIHKEGYNSTKKLVEKKLNTLLFLYSKARNNYGEKEMTLQYAEVGLFLIHLKELELINEDIVFNLLDKTSDDYIKKASLIYHKAGFFDLLDGAVTLYFYIMKSRCNNSLINDDNYIDDFIKAIFENSRKAILPYSGIYWKSYAVVDKKWSINLGISHGIPGLTMFLTKLYPHLLNERQKANILSLIEDSLAFLDSTQCDNKNYSFPGCMDIDFSNIKYKTFLAWCYGDLSIAKLYYEASRTSSRFNLYSEKANVIIQKAFNRELIDELCFKHVGICHGAAGVLMMYNSLISMSAAIDSERNINFWINNVLQQFNNSKNECLSNIHFDFSLLDGLSGVGLSLLEMIDSGLCKWKEFFFFD
jgi:hypothetical protein